MPWVASWLAKYVDIVQRLMYNRVKCLFFFCFFQLNFERDEKQKGNENSDKAWLANTFFLYDIIDLNSSKKNAKESFADLMEKNLKNIILQWMRWHELETEANRIYGQWVWRTDVRREEVKFQTHIIIIQSNRITYWWNSKWWQ